MTIFRREWGAITFVLTVLIGAVAVAISLVVQGAHAPPVPTLAPCPSYTPYVITPVPSASASTSPSAGPRASALPSTSASASPAATAAGATTPSPSAFNPALANCPTAPTRPSTTPTAVGSTPTATAVPTPTPAPTPTPTSAFPTLPPPASSSP